MCGGGAWFFPDGWFLREPAALLRAMANSLQSDDREGAAVHCEVRSGGAGDVVRLEAPPHGGAMLHTADGAPPLKADKVVIAAGAHSAMFARQLGERIPLDTERGYHVAFKPQSDGGVFRRAVCSAEAGFIASPMAGGLRAAGLVEFGGTAAPPVTARWNQLEEATHDLLRSEAQQALGKRDQSRDWLGFRPTLPDALPVLGPSRRSRDVVYNFGGQHVGWTIGGIAGEVAAALCEGREPPLDIAPYQAKRFRLW